MKTAAIGARIPEPLKHSVAELSSLSGQSVSAITEAALREYIAWRAPQLLDLQEAVKAADRGEFATESEVALLFSRHQA